MSLLKSLERIAELNKEIAICIAAPEAARKELAGAILGHARWDSYGLQEVRGKDLHEAALAAVTDKLIEDLTERKREQLQPLIQEFDEIRQRIVDEAKVFAFDQLDTLLAARSF